MLLQILLLLTMASHSIHHLEVNEEWNHAKHHQKVLEHITPNSVINSNQTPDEHAPPNLVSDEEIDLIKRNWIPFAQSAYCAEGLSKWNWFGV